MKITTNEFAVLDHIALNLYQTTNGAVPETFADTDAVWSLAITDSDSKLPAPEGKALGAVVSSLSQKGLVHCQRDRSDGRNNDTVALTEAGFEAWQRGREVYEFAGGGR